MKRTVTLEPFCDQLVKAMQAVILQDGWTANYSTALNSFLLGSFYEHAYKTPHPPRHETILRLGEYFRTRTVPKDLKAQDWVNMQQKVERRKARDEDTPFIQTIA